MAGLIFLSYDRADRERARQLADRFDQEHYEVWWDAHLVAGQRFEHRIRQALDRAACVVVLWSAASIDSDWVKDEAAEGSTRQILVPVLIDAVDIPMGFRQIHTARVPGWTDDSTAEPDFTEVLRAVSELVTARTGKMTAAPTAHGEPSTPQRHGALPMPSQLAAGHAAAPGALDRSARAASTYHGEGHASKRPAWVWLAALAAVLVLAAGYMLRFSDSSSSGGASSTSTADGAASPGNVVPAVQNIPGSPPMSTGATQPIGTSYTPAKEGDMQAGPGAGIVDFRWPGSDCWQILRGDQVAASGCGAGKQALQVGIYTIKGQLGTPFLPFTTEVRDRTISTVAGGGVHELKWPGVDCWHVLRGDQIAASGCGAGKQALQGGDYTLTPQLNAPFIPMSITIRDGATTTTAIGGTFELKWPGSDCWHVMRGEQIAASGCGSDKQALQGGDYMLKGQLNAPFLPTPVTIRDGATTTKTMGGTFDFKWPGNDCWQAMRNDHVATSGCGAGKYALQTGTYTIKPQGASPFAPFTIRIRDGETTTAP